MKIKMCENVLTTSYDYNSIFIFLRINDALWAKNWKKCNPK